MNIKKFGIFSLLVCTVLAMIFRIFIRPALAKSIVIKESDNVTFDELDAYVEQQIRRLNMPGVSLAVVEGDKIVHQRNYGRAHQDGKAPTSQTPFMIGSLTKSFTALAVMQLVESGKIELDAPVQNYLPWFRVADPQASAQITVRHLLNQTSGLTSLSGEQQLADFDDSPGATERQARELSTLQLDRPAGSAFEYSNSNYNLLGLIIKAVSGESYADYIQNHIFSPLDMNHSYTSQAKAKQNGLATGHQYWFWLPIARKNLPVPVGSLPSGQLISTSEDMAHYMIALLNEGRYGDAQILSGAGIAEMHRGVAEDVKMGIMLGKYGMGWYISDIGQTKMAWHTGMVPEFSSYMALIPEQKKGVVLLINADHYMMNPVLAEFGEGVTRILAGEQAVRPQFGFLPWVFRGLLLIPVLQIIGVAATLRLLRRWHRDPLSCPSKKRLWGQHLLLPLIPNLLVALSLIPLLGSTRNFLMLFMPDYSWIAIICGGFAWIWTFLRTGLVFRTWKKVSSPSNSCD